MSQPHRSVLDSTRRRTIIALLANGNSRRTAARYVGCSPATITRTAARDPEFAKQVARAEVTAAFSRILADLRALPPEVRCQAIHRFGAIVERTSVRSV